ncbi:hypothetical protein [Glycomyces xiaoerkulensis]|uniref:hypothetical protein n=1 Tax=Glycomyces xiaoerkulensis TaxID=2038139 RepID=UPI000C268912|nr:hypothetical protein [Glycomyces xiaoerkulensis]
MGDGVGVEPEELRGHASNLESLKARFKAASCHIQQEDEAYGLLCSWMPSVLEARHTRQDELIAFAEDNLDRAARAVRQTADDNSRSFAEQKNELGNLGRSTCRMSR